MIEKSVNSTDTNEIDLLAVVNAVGPGRPIFAGPVDAMMLLGEWSFRQIYWRSELLRSSIRKIRARKKVAIQSANKDELKNYLTGIGVCEGSLVMAHTSVNGFGFSSDSISTPVQPNPIRTAQELVSLLVELVGESGTLVMPTQPAYKETSSQSGGPLFYDPKTTPCGIGLANELFRRLPGTARSLFPYNPLAARGPLSHELLKDNLVDEKPLAHGIHSGYYRFAARNGLILSIGVPLLSCLTLTHVAEEIRDQNWSVPDFFEEKEYRVRIEGEEKTVTIRKIRNEFLMFCGCRQKYRRDLLREGILHEKQIGGVRVDWAHSREIIQFILERNDKSTYPFFGTSLIPRKARAHAA